MVVTVALIMLIMTTVVLVVVVVAIALKIGVGLEGVHFKLPPFKITSEIESFKSLSYYKEFRWLLRSHFPQKVDMLVGCFLCQRPFRENRPTLTSGETAE